LLEYLEESTDEIVSVLGLHVVLAVIVSRLGPHLLLINESDLLLESLDESLDRLLVVQALSLDHFFEELRGL